MNYNEIKPITDRIKNNINKVIIGKEEVIELLLTAIIAKGNVLLEDVPGTGKTLLAKSLAKSLNASFTRIQFTPDLLPSDITGINFYNQKQGEFVFKEGPLFANIVLGDEINRATPRTQSALLECMEEGQVTVDGVTRELDKPFFVIATQNPIDTSGTFPLPEAQLDRFIMMLDMGYPSHEEEVSIMDRFNETNPLDTLTPVCEKSEIIAMQEAIKQVYIHPHVQDYMVKLIHKTRVSNEISAGVSPRGTLALARCARAYASIKGRGYVLPEDIKKLAPFVLAHRLLMVSSYNKKAASKASIETFLNEVPVPTEDFTAKQIIN